MDKTLSYDRSVYRRNGIATSLAVGAAGCVAFWSGSASAQSTLLPCPAAEATIESLQSRTNCLDERIRELDQSQRMLRDSFNEVFNQLQNLGIEIAGPQKLIELIPPVKMARTYAYWSNGTEGAMFECVPLPEKPGYVIWGAEMQPPDIRLIPPINTSNLNIPGNLEQFGAETIAGCSRLWPGRTVEFYTAMSRSAGCYIDATWLDWFRAKSDSVESYETVCQ